MPFSDLLDIAVFPFHVLTRDDYRLTTLDVFLSCLEAQSFPPFPFPFTGIEDTTYCSDRLDHCISPRRQFSERLLWICRFRRFPLTNALLAVYYFRCLHRVVSFPFSWG